MHIFTWTQTFKAKNILRLGRCFVNFKFVSLTQRMRWSRELIAIHTFTTVPTWLLLASLIADDCFGLSNPSRSTRSRSRSMRFIMYTGRGCSVIKRSRISCMYGQRCIGSCDPLEPSTCGGNKKNGIVHWIYPLRLMRFCMRLHGQLVSESMQLA